MSEKTMSVGEPEIGDRWIAIYFTRGQWHIWNCMFLKDEPGEDFLQNIRICMDVEHAKAIKVAGHAASTRAAVIAELERLKQSISSPTQTMEFIGPIDQRLRELRAEQELVTEDRIVSDGFGNHWSKCERADCELQVVRPGKVQCNCDSGNEQTGEGDNG